MIEVGSWGTKAIGDYLASIEEIGGYSVTYDPRIDPYPAWTVKIKWAKYVWKNVREQRLIEIRNEIERHIPAVVALHLL
jgi:hypothetical protein